MGEKIHISYVEEFQIINIDTLPSKRWSVTYPSGVGCMYWLPYKENSGRGGAVIL